MGGRRIAIAEYGFRGLGSWACRTSECWATAPWLYGAQLGVEEDTSFPILLALFGPGLDPNVFDAVRGGKQIGLCVVVALEGIFEGS